jgi:teichoic acid transport system permease protein
MTPSAQADLAKADASRHDSGFTTEYQVYEPHKTGIPPLKPYLTELWRRRHFLTELSRTTMRAANTRTMFGQAWLILNPLLLAGVYFVLVQILGHNKGGVAFLDHLVAGLFGYYFVSGTIINGSTSVVSSGALIANMSFPRLLMPLASLRTGLYQFLPTVPVFLLIHGLSVGFATKDQLKTYPIAWSWHQLLAVYFLMMMALFGGGLACIFAALQVYFRDVSSFLPYLLRLWLYMSPVVWTIQTVPHRLERIMAFNPLFSIIGGWTYLYAEGNIPPVNLWVRAGVWGIVVFVAGSLFYVSREREFAVRL